MHYLNNYADTPYQLYTPYTIYSKVICEQMHAGIKDCVSSAGNSLDYTKEDMEIMQKYHVALKDMETPAIALVCELFHKPFFAIKGVTDIVSPDHPTPE